MSVLYTKIIANNSFSKTEKHDDLGNLDSSQSLRRYALYSTHTDKHEAVESNVQTTFHPFTLKVSE